MPEFAEYAEIWLSPSCLKCALTEAYIERLWCCDPQENCEECGKGWSRYVLAEEGKTPPPEPEE